MWNASQKTQHTQQFPEAASTQQPEQHLHITLHTLQPNMINDSHASNDIAN